VSLNRKSKDKIIMTDDGINKAYIEKYVTQAKAADSEDAKNNALYRVGSYLEVIPCTGNMNLTPIQQERVFKAAEELLGGNE